jgi:hypothetical protein
VAVVGMQGDEEARGAAVGRRDGGGGLGWGRQGGGDGLGGEVGWEWGSRQARVGLWEP